MAIMVQRLYVYARKKEKQKKDWFDSLQKDGTDTLYGYARKKEKQNKDWFDSLQKDGTDTLDGFARKKEKQKNDWFDSLQKDATDTLDGYPRKKEKKKEKQKKDWFDSLQKDETDTLDDYARNKEKQKKDWFDSLQKDGTDTLDGYARKKEKQKKDCFDSIQKDGTHTLDDYARKKEKQKKDWFDSLQKDGTDTLDDYARKKEKQKKDWFDSLQKDGTDTLDGYARKKEKQKKDWFDSLQKDGIDTLDGYARKKEKQKKDWFDSLQKDGTDTLDGYARKKEKQKKDWFDSLQKDGTDIDTECQTVNIALKQSSIGKNAIVGGVDLCAEITNVMRSMMPIIEKETLKKVQAILETKERPREEELRELQNRKVFLMTSPPQFHGDIDDPIVVSDWIMEMENAFDLCKCSDDNKVLYASYMLRGKALYWWNMIKESRGKETLMNQGYDSVQDYTMNFHRSVRFGTINAATENRNIQRFIGRLNCFIRGRVASWANLKTFEEAVHKGTKRYIHKGECDAEREVSDQDVKLTALRSSSVLNFIALSLLSNKSDINWTVEIDIRLFLHVALGASDMNDETRDSHKAYQEADVPGLYNLSMSIVNCMGHRTCPTQPQGTKVRNSNIAETKEEISYYASFVGNQYLMIVSHLYWDCISDDIVKTHWFLSFGARKLVMETEIRSLLMAGTSLPVASKSLEVVFFPESFELILCSVFDPFASSG
ncbi:hypothetical protein Tco_0538584 [Tanacetum coccineum]